MDWSLWVGYFETISVSWLLGLWDCRYGLIIADCGLWAMIFCLK